MTAREFLKRVVKIENRYLRESGHDKESCSECRRSWTFKQVAENMLRDNDFPENDVDACMDLWNDNVEFMLEHRP